MRFLEIRENVPRFETFFDENEYFKSVELGWSTAQFRFFFNNVHVTVWHVDDVAATGNPDGSGVNFSASTIISEWRFSIGCN